MNTAKNDILIGLNHEYCYLDGEINFWWWQRIKIWCGEGGEVYWEEFFLVEEWASF